MKKISNVELLNILEKIIFIALSAKFLALIVWWYLPDIGVELNKNVSCVMPYQEINFKNMLDKTEKIKIQENGENIENVANINDIILKGVYGNKDYGYAIVADKRHPDKTSIISVGENYKGYKLTSIYLDYVIFTKGGKDYILKFKEVSEKNRVVTSNEETQNSEVAQVGVKRKDINYYRHHFSDIWKDIAIDEVKKNGRVYGFVIKRIRKGSKMAQLGLKKGDIILKANNIRLNSYNSAMIVYKDIDKIKTLHLVIKRGDEEKEITYEIH